MRCLAGTPSAIYAANTPPATVEKPEVMTECSSEREAEGRSGAMSKGACSDRRGVGSKLGIDSVVNKVRKLGSEERVSACLGLPQEDVACGTYALHTRG
jgi:hypothetical protein